MEEEREEAMVERENMAKKEGMWVEVETIEKRMIMLMNIKIMMIIDQWMVADIDIPKGKEIIKIRNKSQDM